MSVSQLLDGLDVSQLPAWAATDAEPTEEPRGKVSERTIKIFLASLAELRADRDEFDLYFRQQNDRLRKQGLYLQVVRWENFLDAMSETRLQDEYNKAVRDCDVFVSLFATKARQFTLEEFAVALEAFKESGRPQVYTYIKEAPVTASTADRHALQSLWALQDELKELGHFYTPYQSTDQLKRHFKDQLELLREQEPE